MTATRPMDLAHLTDEELTSTHRRLHLAYNKLTKGVASVDTLHGLANAHRSTVVEMLGRRLIHKSKPLSLDTIALLPHKISKGDRGLHPPLSPDGEVAQVPDGVSLAHDDHSPVSKSSKSGMRLELTGVAHPSITRHRPTGLNIHTPDRATPHQLTGDDAIFPIAMSLGSAAHVTPHTDGQEITYEGRKIAWAPTATDFPKWAAGSDLYFANGINIATAWKLSLDAKKNAIGRTIIVNQGRSTLRARAAAEPLPHGVYGHDDLTFVTRRMSVAHQPMRTRPLTKDEVQTVMEKKIVRVPGGWEVRGRSGRSFGTYRQRDKALQRLRQVIGLAVHHRGGKRKPPPGSPSPDKLRDLHSKLPGGKKPKKVSKLDNSSTLASPATPTQPLDDYLPADPCIAAGIACVASDTGRVLMLQRHIDDPNHGGSWEFPGGTLEPGETPMDAAQREWQEETGIDLPDGEVVGEWTSPDGVYRGFVYLIDTEADLHLNADPENRTVTNPDDPDQDEIETLAFWSPHDAALNPALRPECSTTDWSLIDSAALSKATMTTADLASTTVDQSRKIRPLPSIPPWAITVTARRRGLIKPIRAAEEFTVTDPIAFRYHVAKSIEEQRYTLGPVYIPNSLDAHGEWTDATELEKAMWKFYRSTDHKIRLQHSTRVAGEMVGGPLVLPWPLEVELTLPVNGQLTKRLVKFPPNTPWAGTVWEPWAWVRVKNGDLTGYSIGGTSGRMEVEFREAA